MTTLVESAAKTLIEVRESEKSQNVMSMKSCRALEQAIAQEQKPLFKELIDKHPGLADKLASQSANTNPVVSQNHWKRETTAIKAGFLIFNQNKREAKP